MTFAVLLALAACSGSGHKPAAPHEDIAGLKAAYTKQLYGPTSGHAWDLALSTGRAACKDSATGLRVREAVFSQGGQDQIFRTLIKYLCPERTGDLS